MTLEPNPDPGTPPRRRITEHAAPREDVSALRKQMTTFVACGVIVLLVIALLRGDVAPFLVVGAIVLALGALIGIEFWQSRRRHGRGGTMWVGSVAFDEADFDDKARFPDVIAKSRSKRSQIGRLGLSGGHLQIERGGIRWTAGSLLTPGSLLGGWFFLPWESIRSVDVCDIPFKVRWIRCGIRIYIGDEGQHLYGELLGSRRMLLGALRDSPLGQ